MTAAAFSDCRPQHYRASPPALRDPDAATDVTESVLLHFIFTTGLRCLKEEAEEQAYDRLAEEQRATADRRRAEARRRRPSWADDE